MALASLLLAIAPLLAPSQRPDRADEQYQYVAGLYDKGLHELVVKEARTFLKEHPDHPRASLARYRLASSLFELEKPAEAAPEFRTLCADAGFTYRGEAALRLGQCELELEHLDRAEAALNQALASGEDYLRAPAAFLLGEARFRSGDYAEASKRYAEALERAPEGEYAPLALRGLAWCDRRTDANAKAAQRAQLFLQRYPQHELANELRFLAGDALLAAGDPRAALDAWKSVQEGPFFDAALRGRGFALSALGDLDASARAFGELLARFPDGRFAAEAALQQGAHLVRAGRAEEALVPLNAKVAGEGSELLYWRARAESESGAKERALATVDRALAAKPEGELSERLRALRGDLAFDLGRLDEAARDYERSGSDYALHAAAIAHLNAGRYDEAARVAGELLEQHAGSPYANATRLALGEARFAQKRYDEALAAFAPLAAAGDDVPRAERSRALSRVAWCRYLQGELDQAATLFAGLAERFDDANEADEALFMAGRAREEAGDAEGARKAFAKHLERFPKSERRGEASLHLARLEPGTARLEALVQGGAEGELAERALFELAQRQEKAGELSEAAQTYGELLRRYPTCADAPAARYAKAWCLERTNEPAQALRELETLLRTPPEGELALAALELSVWAARDAGEIERCVSAWRAFGAQCRDEARAFRAAGAAARALEAGGRPDEAQQLLNELAGRVRDPGVALELCLERSRIALRAGELDAAEKDVQRAFEFAKQRGAAEQGAALAEAAFFTGEALFDAKQYQRADALYASAARVEGSAVAIEASYKQGFARLMEEDPARAAESFRAVVDAGSSNELFGEGLFLLGEALYRAGRFQEAVAPLARLCKEMPKHESVPKALFRLGLARFELGDFKGAEAALSELARKAPDFENRAEAEWTRGRALAELGDARGARAAFERVVGEDPGVMAARARLGLGRLALDAQDLDEALGQFLKVSLLFAHEAEVSEALYWAGRCLEAQKEPELARRQYQELLDEHADSAFAGEARERMKGL